MYKNMQKMTKIVKYYYKYLHESYIFCTFARFF